MKAEKLLAKLQFEAAEKDWNDRRLQATQLQTKPQTKAEQSWKTLHHLRARTAEIEEELNLRAQVEREQERFCKAERALREKNRTLAERKVYDAEIRRGQILFRGLWPRPTRIGASKRIRMQKSIVSNTPPPIAQSSKTANRKIHRNAGI